MLLEPAPVALDPGDDGVAAVEHNERLGGHRAVVGEAAGELRAGACQHLERFVEYRHAGRAFLVRG